MKARHFCCDFYLDTCKDGKGAAAKDGVLQYVWDVLVPGLHQADWLAEGEGQGARPVMILQVVADWKISVNRNAVLREMIPWTNTCHKRNNELIAIRGYCPCYLTTSGAGQS